MSWIAYTLAMFIFSVLLYVVVRYGKQIKMSAALLTLSPFALPLVFLTIIIFIQKIPLNISLSQIVIIGFAAVFFSFMGNFLSMKGIKASPNPGFSLIIQKSYGAFTLFVAPILFESEITLKGVVGTFLIILFGVILTSEKGKKFLSKDNVWIAYSLGAFFCFGLLSLTSKYLFTQEIQVYVYMFFLYIFVLTIGVIKLLLNNKTEKTVINIKVVTVVALIGILAFMFNVTKNLAVNIAPNIGYVNAANAGSIAALTVVSAIVFKDKLTLRKMIGVVGIFIGLVLIFI